MGTNTLSQNINQAIRDFDSVREAIINKGVEIPEGTPTSQYGAKIGEIQTGGGGGETPTKGFVPAEWDNDGYPTKGTLYGMTKVPMRFFYSANGNSGQYFNLYNITFEKHIESIEDYAFNGCKSLNWTSLPEKLSNLVSIGGDAFVGCKNLALTSLPEGLTSIGNEAFWQCSKLALTSLPEGITKLPTYVFNGCTNLALTSLPEGLNIIGDNALRACTNLVLTSIPNGVTSIGTAAFYGCTGLTSLTIGSAIKTIGSNAFANCPNLTSITINRAEGAVTGAPWGATNAQINWVGTN